MARPKGSKNNSSTQKQPAKTQQETIETINLSPEAADNILEGLESPPSPNEALLNAVTNSEEFQKSAEDWENRVVGAQEEFAEAVKVNLTEPLSPSEDDKTAENASEEVLEVVAEDSSENRQVETNESGKISVSGGTLAETVEKVLSLGYRGAEFGSSWPLIKKWPYQVQLQITQELTKESPLFDPKEDYYTIILRHYNPVDFMRLVLELGRVGVVINPRDIGLNAKGAFQFKLFSPVPLNSSIYGLTVKPRTPIIYTKERLESFNDKQLEMIKLSLELSETKREDIIEAILEAQDK